MRIYEIMFWISLVLWLASAITIAVIQLRLTCKFGLPRGLFKTVLGHELKLSKLAMIAFIAGTLLFIIGAILRRFH